MLTLTEIDKKLNNIFIGQTYCLDELFEEWSKRRPLENQRVLLNCHLTLNTLFILKLLLVSGAYVEVATIGGLIVQEKAKAILRDLNVSFYQNKSEIRDRSSYDVLIDCAAGLYEFVQPQKGIVELTKTDRYLGFTKDYPIVSVDSTPIKSIETFYGTGDSLWSVLELIFSQAHHEARTTTCAFHSPLGLVTLQRANSKNSYNPIDHKYGIVGFGKVGRGIANALLNHGVPRKHLIVMDTQNDACQFAIKASLPALQLNLTNITAIKNQLNSCNFIITATGVAECMSNWFQSKDINKSLNLINMGTHDEWGSHFQNRTLNGGKPANFSLEYPTSMKYLDPIFTALCIAAERVASGSLQPRLQALSNEECAPIIDTWNKCYGESLI